MIDEKRSFRKIIKEWGHDVYLQRILANGNHSDSFERVTTRHVNPSGITNAAAMKDNLDGLFTRYDSVYYFEADVNPKEGDRIYENFSMKKTKDFSMFRINAVSANRGKYGKIIFWTVGVSREK